MTGESNTGHGNALTATLTIKVSSAFRKIKIKGFLYWAIKSSNFQEAMQSTNLQAEVTMMAVQFLNVKRFFFLHKFFGPKNPLMSAGIAYFVFLRRNTKKTRSRS